MTKPRPTGTAEEEAARWEQHVRSHHPQPESVPPLLVVIGGVSLTVDLATVNGIEWRAARAAGGYPTQRAILAALDDREFDAVAAVFWVCARREDDTVGYADVLAGCSYSTMSVG